MPDDRFPRDPALLAEIQAVKDRITTRRGMADDRLPTPEQIANLPKTTAPSTCLICWQAKDEELDQGVCADCNVNLKRRAIELASENARLQQAIDRAASVLDTAGRNPRAAFVASVWLRTAYPADHPNYLTAEQAEAFDA